MSLYSCLRHASASLSNPAHSKKKVLETLAQMLGENSGVDVRLIFEQLFEREKIGTTALGKGVALPHCRITGINAPFLCLLRTQTGIDYGASDESKTSLFFALLIPEGENKEYLELIAELAQRLESPGCVDKLQKASTTAQIIEILQN